MGEGEKGGIGILHMGEGEKGGGGENEREVCEDGWKLALLSPFASH